MVTHITNFFMWMDTIFSAKRMQKGQDFVGRVELAKPDMQDSIRLCRVSLRSTYRCKVKDFLPLLSICKLSTFPLYVLRSRYLANLV